MTEASEYLRPVPEDVVVEGSGEGIAEIGRRLMTLGTEIERELQEMSTLREVLARINTGVTLDEIAEYIYESFRPLIPYDRIGLALLEQDDTVVRAHWARSDVGRVRLGRDYSAPLKGSTLQRVLETGEPRIIDDLEAYLASKPSSESTRLIVEEGMRSSLTCPLIAVGEPVGFLFFSSKQPATYRDVHVETFTDIATTLSVIVEKGQLYDRLETARHDLEETVVALSTANQEIERLTRTDALTEVANRRALEEALERAISFARRRDLPLTLVMADLDHFKSINDTHGHAAGDRVLVEFARLLDRQSRAEDTVGRWGGEEFLAVLPASDAEAGRIFAERCRLAFSECRPVDPDTRITASFGVAELRGEDGTDDLLRRVDELLYAAKDRGRDGVVGPEARRSEEDR